MFGSALGGAPVAGPLIGGGVTQAVTLGTKLLTRKTSPKVAKWAPTIGFVVGGGLSAFLATRSRSRDTGIAGLVTAALIAIPQQVENLLGTSGTMQGYLGIITPEDGMIQGAFGEGPAVELLDSGGGGMGSLGVTTAEQEMAGFGEGGGVGSEIELLGAGFGSNFLS
jgi:hypothetical protein